MCWQDLDGCNFTFYYIHSVVALEKVRRETSRPIEWFVWIFTGRIYNIFQWAMEINGQTR
jgi:hypothetical protein